MASKTPPSDALALWIREQRWFGAKDREIRRLVHDDRIAVGRGAISVISIELDDGTVQRYALPLAGDALNPPRDALDDGAFCRALLALIERDGRAQGEHGEIVGQRTPAFPRVLPADLASRRLSDAAQDLE